mgnify:FL=1
MVVFFPLSAYILYGTIINIVFSLQDRSSSYDTMKFTNFETQLLDIMRNTTMNDAADQIKGKLVFEITTRSAL